MKKRVRPGPRPGFSGTLGFLQLGFDRSSALRDFRAGGRGGLAAATFTDGTQGRPVSAREALPGRMRSA